MIDFHSHIIPGVDDGSSSMDMTINMLQRSLNEGTSSICATPHFIYGECEISRAEYDSALDNLKQNINEISILPGLEVYINPNLVELYKSEKIWGINDTRYMLIELPMNDFPIYTEDVLYNLRLEGVVPVLAHPERNIRIIKNIDLLINLFNEGTIIQMNAGSLIGLYGSYVKEFAERLVKMNLVHVLGSDAHNDTRRTTRLKEGFDFIENNNPELFKAILSNSSAIVNGEEIVFHPGIRIKKQSFFKRLFGTK